MNCGISSGKIILRKRMCKQQTINIQIMYLNIIPGLLVFYRHSFLIEPKIVNQVTFSKKCFLKILHASTFSWFIMFWLNDSNVESPIVSNINFIQKIWFLFSYRNVKMAILLHIILLNNPTYITVHKSLKQKQHENELGKTKVFSWTTEYHQPKIHTGKKTG